ncbi:MAG: hypothetical protein E7568_06410 [Ruminococcaceae bacterium]|nr:hypothetical protein [Oscillospiraceae bacterium]
MSEILSYGLLTASTVMFGFMFFFSDMFRRNYGSGFKATVVSHIGGGIIGFIAIFIINIIPLGFKTVLSQITAGFSPFVVIMSLLTITNGYLFSYCSFKSLGKINLSLYSLFSMLGGMALPFVSGILFHGEPLTVAKLVCFAIITIALLITTEKGKGKDKAAIYYIGVFTFNGMSGVLAKIYQAMPYTKMDSTGYSLFKTLLGIIIAVLLLFIVKGENKKLNLKSIIAMAGSGTLSNVANWLILIALYILPASVQYPFITGGTMIVSTIISLFCAKKPNKKEIFAVILSFLGILLLIYIPEINILKITWR